jgi:hypothetical protein
MCNSFDFEDLTQLDLLEELLKNMSMNLYLKLDDQFYEKLWQTPTYIAHMCLVNADGFVNNLFAEDALRVWKPTKFE